MEKKFMYVDDIAVELNGEKNVLEVIRKAGIPGSRPSVI